ncbi:MAG: hypothetical protein K0U36_05360 [Alphaproteobacteria bacterium]|nr:hypothetical protein [Alphaproteobacteria bacterium]
MTIQPAFRIEHVGGNLSDAFAQRTMRVALTDTLGIASDQLTVTLDNRDNRIAFPSSGARLKVALGYQDEALIDHGDYQLDEVTYQAPPARLVLRARATGLSGLLVPRTRQLTQATVGGFVRQIATEQQLIPLVDPLLDILPLPESVQTGESDINLLQRVVRPLGGVVKPVAGKLVVSVVGLPRSASGQSLEEVTVHANEVSAWQSTWRQRDQYLGVKVQWRAPTGEVETVTLGTEPFFVVNGVYGTLPGALSRASGLLQQLSGNQSQLSLRMPGRPEVFAGTPLQLQGFTSAIPQRWTVTEAVHTIDDQGYVLMVTAHIWYLGRAS